MFKINKSDYIYISLLSMLIITLTKHKCKFSLEEQKTIIRLHDQLGNK